MIIRDCLLILGDYNYGKFWEYKGLLYLYGLLHLGTDSENVDDSVVAQPDPNEALFGIAQLAVASASGYIRCKYPTWDAASIPDRDYRTSASAHYGDIRGED